jgi:hypothetical protein
VERLEVPVTLRAPPKRDTAFMMAALPLVKTFNDDTFIIFTYADPNGLVEFPIFEEPAIFGKRFPDNVVDVLRTTKFPKINEFPVETTSPKWLMMGMLLVNNIFFK